MATTSAVDYERVRRGRWEPRSQRRWLDRIIDTDEKLAPAIARWTLGIVLFPHGAQKMLGWFGGPGWSASITGLGSVGLPSIVAALVILVEFFATIALVVGVFSRVAAIGIASIMVGAILTVHAKFGFFMNWMGQKAGEGYQFHLLVIGLALVVFFAGGGVASVDRVLTHKRAAR